MLSAHWRAEGISIINIILLLLLSWLWLPDLIRGVFFLQPRARKKNKLPTVEFAWNSRSAGAAEGCGASTRSAPAGWRYIIIIITRSACRRAPWLRKGGRFENTEKVSTRIRKLKGYNLFPVLINYAD